MSFFTFELVTPEKVILKEEADQCMKMSNAELQIPNNFLTHSEFCICNS